MLLDVYTQAIETERTSSRYKGRDRSLFVEHLTTMAPPWAACRPICAIKPGSNGFSIDTGKELDQEVPSA